MAARMILQVKLLLLSFSVALSTTETFRNSTGKTFETSTKVIFEFSQSAETQPSVELMKTREVSNDLEAFPGNGTYEHSGKNMTKETVTEMLRRVSSCYEKHSIMPKRTSDFRLPGGRKHQIKATPGRNSSLFHCNVSKELVEGLRDKLHQLEIFQGIIVLHPMNWSSDASSEAKVATRGRVSPKEKTGRTGRDVLWKNDQIESNTKVPQISHIYLGRSLYPFLTEESRIISRDHTLPPPVYTGPTYTDYNEK